MWPQSHPYKCVPDSIRVRNGHILGQNLLDFDGGALTAAWPSCLTCLVGPAAQKPAEQEQKGVLSYDLLYGYIYMYTRIFIYTYMVVDMHIIHTMRTTSISFITIIYTYAILPILIITRLRQGLSNGSGRERPVLKLEVAAEGFVDRRNYIQLAGPVASIHVYIHNTYIIYMYYSL